MEENYILAKDIAKSKVGEDSIFYPLFVLCIYGLLSKFPKYKKIVEDVFLEAIIIIGDKTINEMMRDEGLEPTEYFGADFDDKATSDTTNFVRGIAISDNKYVIYKKKEFINEKTDSYIFCTKKESDEACLMLTLMHEASHLIKSKINTTYKTYGSDYFGYVLRNGLSVYEYRYYPNDDTYSEGESYGVFDEAINCLQTQDAAKEILAIDGIIPDESVQEFFDYVDKEELSKDVSYEAISNILSPLWQNDTFRNLIEDNIVLRNIDKIINEFDGVMGDGCFDDLDDLLILIERLDIENKNNSIKMKKAQDNVLKHIHTFYDKTSGFFSKK